MTLWSWLFRGWHVSTEKSRARAAAEAARPKPAPGLFEPGRLQGQIPSSQYLQMMQNMQGYDSDHGLLQQMLRKSFEDSQRK